VDFLAAETIPIAKNLHVEIARDSLTGPLQFSQSFAASRAAQNPLATLAPERHQSAASLELDISKWGSLGLTTQTGIGSPDLVGDFMPGPLSFTDTESRSAAGLSAHLKLGDGWVTNFSYGFGVRQLDLRAGASDALAERSSHSQSYGISIAKYGLFGNNDALGLSVTRPSDDYFGGISLADSGIENGVNLVNTYRAVPFGTAKETDIGLGYVTSFFHGALSLQANAGYQMNANGQNGANAVTVLSRAKINF
jgi:hypothetical protein